MKGIFTFVLARLCHWWATTPLLILFRVVQNFHKSGRKGSLLVFEWLCSVCRMSVDYDDVLYGRFEISPCIQTIMETKPFLRLKEVQQLGFLSVIDDVSYKRYEHCVGTYYQARRMLDALERNSAGIAADAKWRLHRLAVEIAALLHDTGHGPYSHTWECVVPGYNHEKMSALCVEYIFDNLQTDDADLLELKQDNYGVELIQNLIEGVTPAAFPDKYKFLFEIVHNKQCKLDVDKLDYLLRDYHYLDDTDRDPSIQKFFEGAGVLTADRSLSFDDIFQNARVSADGRHIEYRYEDYDKIYALFLARFNFHRKHYRKSLNVLCDMLLAKALKRCDRTLCGKWLQAIDASDMEAFGELTDTKVMDLIMDDACYQYLIKPSELQQIQITDNKSAKPSETGIVVRSVVKGAGREMPRDDAFHFYGDKASKKKIVRDMNMYTIEASYAMSD